MAHPQVTYDAVYLADEGEGFVRRPVLGVLIQDEVTIDAHGTIIATGVRRCIMAQQAETGSEDVAAAGGSLDFIGVFPVADEPTPQRVRRARNAMAAVDQHFPAADTEDWQGVWHDDGWTGSVPVSRRHDLAGDAVFTLPAGAVRAAGNSHVEVRLPVELMRWTVDPI